MLDIKLIRKDAKEIERRLKTKDGSISLSEIVKLDEEIRDLKTKVEILKAKRNEVSQKIGELKRQKQDTTALMQEIAKQGDETKALDQELSEKEKIFEDLMARLPNLPQPEIKVAADPKENVVVKTYKEKPTFSFPFKNHVELNDSLDLFDFKRGAKISGTGWPVYKNLGARLEWALLNYMISVHIKNGFTQWMVPIVVRPETVFQSGQLPKFENQQFRVKDEDFNHFLIPTAEVPLNGLHSDETLLEEELPLKYIAYTTCFRREAGAAGSQERGLIRTHQFNKVEMFVFSKPEETEKCFDMMMASAEEILQGLDLHYRNMLLVTGDMSFASTKTIDIEVWLPGQNRYYEVSSVSNCTDFQSRRSNCRYRNKEGKLEFVHTLNGSGLATSRLMVALLENNQEADGSVRIPKVLQPFLGGLEKISP